MILFDTLDGNYAMLISENLNVQIRWFTTQIPVLISQLAITNPLWG